MELKIGIDNYGLYPLGLDPMQVLEWALEHDADGVAFSGLDERSRLKCTPKYLKDLSLFASDNNLYLEWGGGQHIPRDMGNMGNWGIRELRKINRRSAEEAKILGADIIRSCSGGLMRWNPDSIPTLQLMEETAAELRSQLPMLRDYGVILAIETHFEFTTFELIKIFEWCGVVPGDCLGICLDTMNLLTMLEDPVAAAERILPWVVSTHIKDGAIISSPVGMKSYPCRICDGIIDLKVIIDKIKGLSRNVHLSVEDHGGEFDLPISNPAFLREFPDLSGNEMSVLRGLAARTEKLLGSGKCLQLGREAWPEHCENRISNDIKSLKKIVHG